MSLNDDVRLAMLASLAAWRSGIAEASSVYSGESG